MGTHETLDVVKYIQCLVLKNIKKASANADALRAIDGARTRGLDLGKVARYQLRHYRIY